MTFEVIIQRNELISSVAILMVLAANEEHINNYYCVFESETYIVTRKNHITANLNVGDWTRS